MAELPTDRTELIAELKRLIRAREGRQGYGPNVEHANQMLREAENRKPD